MPHRVVSERRAVASKIDTSVKINWHRSCRGKAGIIIPEMGWKIFVLCPREGGDVSEQFAPPGNEFLGRPIWTPEC